MAKIVKNNFKQLLKTAEKRQQLHERRIERKVQKERDAEGDEFADKGNIFQYATLIRDKYYREIRDGGIQTKNVRNWRTRKRRKTSRS